MTTEDEKREEYPPVARVSSPSDNTELSLDIVEEVVQHPLVGALVGIEWKQTAASTADEEPRKTAVLGQITSIGMRNRWHEDQTFKNIVKTRGELPAITKLQDTRTAIMKVGGCFVQVKRECKLGDSEGVQVIREYTHGDLGSVPATGSKAFILRPRFLNEVLKSCQRDLFYLGKDYGGNINFPMWFKHFGNGNGGVREAYHTGIFGKTGSGKTGLAKMLIAAYGRHKGMGILVIDPQGEFSREMEGAQVGQQKLDIGPLLRQDLKRIVHVVTLKQLQLDDWDLLEELLTESRFFETALSIRGADNIRTARDLTFQYWRSVGLENLNTESCVEETLARLKQSAFRIYKTRSYRDEFIQVLDGLITPAGIEPRFWNAWQRTMTMFEGGHTKFRVKSLISALVRPNSNSKPIIVLNLAGTAQHARYADSLQKRIISHIADSIIEGSAKTLGTDQTSNTLVILDEAHRFAPSGIGGQQLESGDKILRDDLRRAVRETRKYGVGWMFISQTMQGLDSELLMQLRTMFFGYGLAFGLEFQRLRELAGGDDDAMDLYRSFRDPHSAMDDQSKQFPFMAIGPISPMPFSGQPLFFSAFNAHDFRAANPMD